VNDKEKHPSLLLSFQTRPESHEMNTIFIRLPSGIEGKLTEILHKLCRERPFWGETDLTRLGTLSDLVDLDISTDIMIATQGGVQGLWVLDSEKNVWTSIGSMDYYSRPREQVTLLMSVTLRKERELLDVSTQSVRIPGSFLRSMVEIGLGTVSAVFRKCKSVRCRVSLDTTEKMFRLSFFRAEEDKEITHLLIKRTVDVLEILRRPDFQCQQVVVDGHEMIWNRFRNIEYTGDAKILRPWVERREPFKTKELKLPATADQYLLMQKEKGLKLEVLHDRTTCPLCAVSKEELKERIQKHAGKILEYLRSMEGSQSQPDDILRDSMYHHGMCWRVMLRTTEELPENVRNLETITLSGPALAALLKTGSLIYMKDGLWVNHEFDVPQVNSLPREFRESIVLVEAYRELVPRALKEMRVPGSYLVKRKEQWIVSPNFHKDAVVWSAQSDTTGETYQGTSFTVLISEGASLEDTTDTILDAIVNTLPSDSVKGLSALREHIKDRLRDKGYKSKHLYSIELGVEGDSVTFYIESVTKSIPRCGLGSIEVSEGMTLETANEKLMDAVSEELKGEEFELEFPDETYDLLAKVLSEMKDEWGWELPDEKKKVVEPPLDPLTVAIDHGRVAEEVKELRRKGKSQQAPGVIDVLLEKVRPALQDNPPLISSFVDALLLKVEVLVSGELAGSVDSVTLLNVLDEIEKYSYHFEPQMLNSSTRFAKQVRWALALRVSLRKNL